MLAFACKMTAPIFACPHTINHGSLHLKGYTLSLVGEGGLGCPLGCDGSSARVVKQPKNYFTDHKHCLEPGGRGSAVAAKGGAGGAGGG